MARITNLIGTTWRFNDIITPYEYALIDVGYKLGIIEDPHWDGDEHFLGIAVEEFEGVTLNVYYDYNQSQGDTFIVWTDNAWEDDAYKVITIGDGTSSEAESNEGIIDWFYANATLIRGGDMAVVWTDTPLIKKITLPSGNTYFIADREGREKIEQLFETISGGVSFVIAWDGASVPVVANIPAGVKVVYQGTTYTGTLAADNAQPGAFYLIKSSTQTSEGTTDVYDEYVPVGDSGSKTWEKIGDTQVDLKDVVMGVTLNKQTDVALGEATTFALTSGAVTFGTPTTDTFVKSVSAETNKNLVTTSITPAGTATSVINSVTPDVSKKLVTTSITGVSGSTSVTGVQASTTSVTGVQSTTTTASKASAASASKATAGTSQTTIKSFTSTTGSGYDPSTDLLQGATVANEILTIGSAAPDTQTTTQYTFSDVNFSDVTVPIKNASATTVPIKATSATTVPTAASSATTVATGAVTTAGTGAAVVTDVTTNTTNVATVGSSVTVATGATSTTGTGDAVVTGVTVGSSAAAITALPTASVGTGITVGTNDKVNVLTNATDITVTKGQ